MYHIKISDISKNKVPNTSIMSVIIGYSHRIGCEFGIWNHGMQVYLQSETKEQRIRQL